MWGSSNYFGALCARAVGARQATFGTHVVNLVFILPVAFIVTGTLTASGSAWGAAGALACVVGFLSMFKAYGLLKMAIVSKLIAGGAILVPFIAGILLGERPGAAAVSGVAMILASMILLSTPSADAEEKHANRRGLQFALLGGVGFGASNVFFGQTSSADGAFPLLAFRVVSLVIMVAIVAAHRESFSIPRVHWRNFAVMGLASGIGDVAFLLALHKGALSLVPAIANLHPGATAIAAFLFMHERLRRPQLVGLLIGLCGVVVMKL